MNISWKTKRGMKKSAVDDYPVRNWVELELGPSQTIANSVDSHLIFIIHIYIYISYIYI